MVDGNYIVSGGLSAYDGTTGAIQNFRAVTSLDKRPELSGVETHAKISVVAGVIPVSSPGPNTVTAITATNDGKSVSLAINPMATPIQTPSPPAAASVGIASGVALAANPARRHLVLVNTSGGNISLGMGQAAVLNSGITLLANGGSYEMSAQQGNLYLGEIRAIAALAASNLSIQEDA